MYTFFVTSCRVKYFIMQSYGQKAAKNKQGDANPVKCEN